MLTRALVFFLWPSLAFGQAAYLVEPTAEDCVARTVAQCTANGCDGVHTKYWWDCDLLASPSADGGVSGTGGTTVLVVHPGTPYGTDGLTEAEIAALETGEDLALGRQRKSVNP